MCDIVQVPLADSQNRHTEDPLRNAGEVVDIQREGDKVYAVMDIRDPSVADKLASKTLLGASAFIHMDYTDTRTGQKAGPTLLHSCITNRPYVTGLDDSVPIRLWVCLLLWHHLPVRQPQVPGKHREPG